MTTPKTKREKQIFLYQSEKDGTKELFYDLIIVRYISRNERICAAIWTHKTIKPSYNYAFKTVEQREQFIDTKKQSEIESQKTKLLYLERAKKESEGIQPGAILYSSWGYEQTNIDFYIVLSRKNDFVTIQEIGQHRTYDDYFNDRGDCEPNPAQRIGEPFRKKITKYGSINLDSYKYCGLYDGRPKSWSSYA